MCGYVGICSLTLYLAPNAHYYRIGTSSAFLLLLLRTQRSLRLVTFRMSPSEMQRPRCNNTRRSRIHGKACKHVIQ